MWGAHHPGRFNRRRYDYRCSLLERDPDPHGTRGAGGRAGDEAALWDCNDDAEESDSGGSGRGSGGGLSRRRIDAHTRSASQTISDASGNGGRRSPMVQMPPPAKVEEPLDGGDRDGGGATAPPAEGFVLAPVIDDYFVS